MMLQPLRSQELRLARPLPVREPKVAVLLNANARRVNDKVLHALSHAIAEEDVFLSRSQLDARRVAQSVLERGYDTVLCGGGDGTFVGFVNEICAELKNRPWSVMPRFGILKLGTGNALAALVNASPGEGFVDDVLRARAGEIKSTRRIHLLNVEGKRAHFAGLGVDGRLLNDYVQLKESAGIPPLRPIFSGASGYFVSIAFKTLPYYLTHSTWFDCEVVNGLKGAAYRLSPDGEQVGDPIAPGEILYRGKLMMAAAGTTPFYGFEFRMFPFALKRPGMMHLRLGAASTPAILANLRKVWDGRWFPTGIQDFHASEVKIRFARPMPLQVGGDAEGYRESLTLAMAAETLELVDLNPILN